MPLHWLHELLVPTAGFAPMLCAFKCVVSALDYVGNWYRVKDLHPQPSRSERDASWWLGQRGVEKKIPKRPKLSRPATVIGNLYFEDVNILKSNIRMSEYVLFSNYELSAIPGSQS